tara:strand:- start:947 stop:1804 length:858 start_codon:yes stop_codon:yes gene_type:complete
MGFLSDLLQSGQDYKSLKRDIKRKTDFRDETLERGTAVGQQGYDQSQFVPFGVTSSLGGVQGTAEGGFDMNLSPDQQAMQDRLFGMSGSFLDEMGGDPFERQQALYEQIRGLQRPNEERQRLELENRLRGQGRLGLMTSQYGGSPEQFAQDMALGETRNQAAYQAYGQSQADRQQSFGLASGLMGLGYKPQQELGSLVQLATPLAGLAQSGRESGAALNVKSMLQTLFDKQSGYGRSGLEIMGLQADKDDARSGFWNNLLGTITGESGGSGDVAQAMATVYGGGG